ncbi:MAG TPA: ABC transporter ATP-binding protein [Puia sp.]|nr:ABC transporter ATP-binding protein [Puia sp.]
MTVEKNIKSTVWGSILRLVLPYKNKFFLVVVLSLLSTGATLIEPLIYREAINDVAGLFVKQAKEDVRKELGAVTDEEEMLTAPDQKGVAVKKDTVEKKNENSKIKPGQNKKIRKKKKEPHTQTHVASRTPEQAISTLLWSVLFLFLINLAGTVIWRISENNNVRLSCLIEQRFIQNTFAHVMSLPLGFFSKRSSAAVAKQIDQSEEVSAIVNGFSQQILPEIISLLGILVIMFVQNVALTAVALIIIPFYLLIAWRSANKLESGLSGYYEKWEDVSTGIQDALIGIKTVKLSGAEQREVNNLQQISGEAYEEYVNRSRLSNKYVFWETMLTHLSTALVLGYGGYLTLQNKLTPGDVVMFVAYLDRLYSPIDSLASLWVSLQQNIASIARAFKLLDYQAEEKSPDSLQITKGKIEFERVHFSYSPGQEVLKGISFLCEPGKVTALVGTSGAGKTTTVDLLLKLYKPASGKILIDGQDIAALDAASVRSQVGTVATDGMVFSGTLADNIRYKRPDSTDSEVKQAALAAGMEKTLERLPEGLMTEVGESGIGLSVGERQRIQIARVLVAKPRILILDEATANLDYATETEIKRTIDEIRKENTVIIIAHRYSMVRDADFVVVLSDGEVIEKGSPANLIEAKGWFADFAIAADEYADKGDAAEEEESDISG